MQSSIHKVLACFLASCLGNFCYGNWQDTAIDQAVPVDIAMLVSVEQPAENISEILKYLDVPIDNLVDLFRELSTTDLVDATDVNAPQGDIFNFPNVDQLNFLLTNSRESVGEFAFVLKLDGPAKPIPDAGLKIMIRLLSKAAHRSLVDRTIPGGQVDSQLAMFESGYAQSVTGNWLVISHSSSLREKLIAKLRGTSAARSLSNSRAFKIASKSKLEGAQIACFVSPRHSKSLIKLWGSVVVDSLNTVAWVQYSGRVSNFKDSMAFDQQTVFRRFSPPGGVSKYWDFYRPIEDLPEADLGQWSRISVRNVDMDQWINQYHQDVDNDGVGERPFDAVKAFHSGIGRRSLGGLAFLVEMENGGEQAWYRVSRDVVDKAAAEVTDYFNGMTRNYQQAGYEIELDLSNTDVWELKIKDAIDTSSGTGDAAAMGSDLEGPKATTPDIPWAHKYATLAGDWFVIGTRQAVLASTTENGSQNSSPLLEQFQLDLETFRLRRDAVHAFRMSRASSIASEFRSQTSKILNRLFGFSWRLSDAAYSAIEKQGMENLQLTNPQRLGYLVRRNIDKVLDSKTRYSKYELIEDQQYFCCERLLFFNERLQN
jgi:hypothetical protein